MKKLTPTQLTYHIICPRKLWLFSNQLTMETTSDLVAEGKLIGETTYPQRPAKWQEVDLGIAKIDFYDPKEQVIHEVKKSNKKQDAHIVQVKYYMYLLQEVGIPVTKAIIEYPKLRQTDEILWQEGDKEQLLQLLHQAQETLLGNCPDKLTKSKCRKCSYFDFCWSADKTTLL